MANKAPTQFRMADLAARKATTFDVMPDHDARKALAADLGIIEIRKLKLQGEIVAQDGHDWHLTAKLGATVVQSCVVTLDPVVSRIDETITRTYLKTFVDPDGGAEAEMPDDDTIEPIPVTLDLEALLGEALSLALPPFPRVKGAELGSATFAAKGTTPMSDEDARPFAGLGALKAALESKDD